MATQTGPLDQTLICHENGTYDIRLGGSFHVHVSDQEAGAFLQGYQLVLPTMVRAFLMRNHANHVLYALDRAFTPVDDERPVPLERPIITAVAHFHQLDLFPVEGELRGTRLA